MLRKLMVAGLIGVAAAGSAVAQTACPCAGGSGVLLGQTQLAADLTGNTVCAVLGTERWQEWHDGTSLFELGENFASPDLVGSWSTTASGQVIYNYGSGGAYTYAVCKEGLNHHFCGASFGGRDVTNATVRPGKATCGAPALAARGVTIQLAPSKKRP